MVRYAKFRFTEVKDGPGRPRLPTIHQPAQLYAFRPRAGSKVARHRDPTCVRRRRRRSTAPPLAFYDFFESIRRTISGHSHVSMSHGYLIFDQVLFDISSPTSSQTHSPEPQYSNISLIHPPTALSILPQGALVHRSVAASTVRAFISQDGVIRGLSGQLPEARGFRVLSNLSRRPGVSCTAPRSVGLERHHG